MAEKTIKFPDRIVRHYLDNLGTKINLQAALLFGSFVWGKPTRHSDVDLVIISPSFRKKSFDSRFDMLSDARDDLACQIAMDVIGYTPQEFSNIEKKSAIIALAKKKGRWLYKAPSLKI